MPARIKQGFNFGGEIAESDPLLAVAFVDNGAYSVIADPTDPHRFIIGRTGSGKSALFEQLGEQHPHRVIRISPDHLSLNYIANLDVVRYLTGLGVHLEIFFVALWKHVIIVELLRHRYNVESPEAKSNLLETLTERFRKDPTKAKALEYLQSFGDRFWCEADERVHQIGNKLEERLGVNMKAGATGLPVSASADVGSIRTEESHQELAARYQKVVNEMQLPRLTDMVTILSNELLDEQHYTYLAIDDLDKDWADEETTRLIIRCLFRTVLDMQRIRNFKVLVALRTNIFIQLNYANQLTGQQDEKIRALALDMQWSKNELVAMLEERAKAACRRHRLSYSRSLDDFLPPGRRSGHEAVNYLVDHTLMRPRDAIRFMNLCLKHAVGKERVSWDIIDRAEIEYAADRLQALTDEWSRPYPGLTDVFEAFRGCSSRMTRAEFTQILDRIAELIFDQNFDGILWLTDKSHLLWESPNGTLTWYDLYGPIIRLLYEVGFIAIARSRQSALRVFHTDPTFVMQPRNFTDSTTFAVNEIFMPALES